MKNLSITTKIAMGLLLIFVITNIILSYISFTGPRGGGEFATLSNFVTSVSALLIIAISIPTLFLFKQKRWAYILTIILIILLLPILAVSDVEEMAIQLAPGAAISLNKEVLPIAILFFLVLGRKDFKKIQSS